MSYFCLEDDLFYPRGISTLGVFTGIGKKDIWKKIPLKVSASTLVQCNKYVSNVCNTETTSKQLMYDSIIWKHCSEEF